MKKYLLSLIPVLTSTFLLNGCENNAGKNIVVSPNIIIGGTPAPNSSSNPSTGTPPVSGPTPSPAPSFNEAEAKREIDQLTRDFVDAINNQETERYQSFFTTSSRDWEKQVNSTESQAMLGFSSVITIIEMVYTSITESSATVTIKQRYYLRGISDGSTSPETYAETIATYKKEGGRWKFETITAR